MTVSIPNNLSIRPFFLLVLALNCDQENKHGGIRPICTYASTELCILQLKRCLLMKVIC